MRVKQIWSHVPLPQNLKLVWQRVSFSKLTIFYFVFAILHCLIQVAFQTRAFMINSDAADFLYQILYTTNFDSEREFSALRGSSSLQMCVTVPNSEEPWEEVCRVVWDGEPRDNWIDTGDEPSQTTGSAALNGGTTSAVTQEIANNVAVPSPVETRTTSTVTVVVLPTAVNNAAIGTPRVQLDDDSDDEEDEEDRFELDRRDNHIQVTGTEMDSQGRVNLTITGMNYDNRPATLSSECLWSLNYPVSILHNTKREDLVFIFFQVWVMGLSIVALLNESIPHILASLATHVLATAWAIYQIFHTMRFQSDFNRIITNGACNGVPLLGPYWKNRSIVEIPALALSGLGLLISMFLTYKLYKLFGWQTFKRVGASLTMNRLYKIVLTLSIIIQLAAFFIIVTVALWLDQLFNTNLGRQATRGTYYQVSSIVILAAVVPWLVLGWLSIRREWKIRMFVFLAVAILYLTGWAAMFFSDTFRWEFMTWTFFGVMSSVSVGLTFLALSLGIVSRFNFGKGLPRFLSAQEELPGDDFAPVGPTVSDPEKVSFPTNGPIPTFSAAFGKGDEVPVPSKMFAQQAGPRFFRSAEPFESSSDGRTTTSSGSTDAALHRTKSNASESSIGSYYSYSGRSEMSTTSKNNRWVIE